MSLGTTQWWQKTRFGKIFEIKNQYYFFIKIENIEKIMLCQLPASLVLAYKWLCNCFQEIFPFAVSNSECCS